MRLALLIAASLSLNACGGTTAPTTCDEFGFFSTFQRGARVSVIEIDCEKPGVNGRPDSALYTIYKNVDGTEVTYWANSKPINVIGDDAPICILLKYNTPYPDSSFDLTQCHTKTLYPLVP